MLSVITPIDIPGNKHWAVIVTAPEAEVLGGVRTLTTILILAAVACLLLGVVFVWLISVKFSKPIIKLRDEAVLLAEGDFRHLELKTYSGDEIGQLAEAFDQMRGKLRDLVGKIQNKAETVAAASEQLTAGAQQSAEASNQVAGPITQIADGSNHQAETLKKMADVVAELSKNINHIANRGKEIADIGSKTAASSTEGRSSIAKAMEQMETIGTGSRAVQTAISELAAGSKEISEIVTLISTIAGQTNLLALNAAIEAARAGEAGRGFAVVAEEVRKLAEESNQAAHKISELIQKNELDMQQAVLAAEKSADGVKTGIAVVGTADETFQMIAVSIERLSGQVQEVSMAIERMAAGSQHLLHTVQQVENVGNENASEAQSVSAATEEQSASMQEIVSASQSLAQTSAELQGAVSVFKI